MSYVASDPRSRLAPAPAGTGPRTLDVGTPTFGRFYQSAPRESGPGFSTWYARGQNFIAGYSKGEAGAVLARSGQPDEYAVLLAERDTEATIRWNGTTERLKGFSLAFVPPGDSEVEVVAPGPVARFFTVASEDLVAHSSRPGDGFAPDPNVPPFEPWPEPRDGHRIRTYSLDVEQAEGRFGRIFRSSTIMVNFLQPRHGPRDPAAMSPHSHDDFQQCSLVVSGEFVHHMRWPWGTDKTKWRQDRHERCAAPSVAFIPARVVHTSESTDPGVNQLVDIFCPPRLDFSSQDGWVLNADEYPMPDGKG
jgi:hypothetical protein